MTAPKWWDLTIPKGTLRMNNVVEAFENAKADKYVIGEEKGTMTGYEHFQCKAHFRKPYTANEMHKLFGHLQAHYEPSICKDFSYCEKEGKFYRSWEGALAPFHDLELRHWQAQLIGELEAQNDRQVTVICDGGMGNVGKSWMAKHLVAKYRYAYVPAMPNFEDYMFMAMAHPNAKGFIFDLPKADTIQQKKAMWMAMETIKNGYLYDKRYEFKEQWREPPKMVVFCNEMPPKDVLSRDRWRKFNVCKTYSDAEYTLYPYRDEDEHTANDWGY